MEPYKKLLASVPGVSAWTIQRFRTTEHQRYLLSDSPESERTIDSCTTRISIMHDHEGGQGEASLSLFGRDPVLERSAVEDAVFRASLQGNPAYELPPPGPMPDVDTEDPELTGDPRGVLDWVQEQVFAKVSEENGVRLSASEIFVTRGENEILTSAGVQARSSGTSVLMEFVLLAAEGESEVESHGSYEVRRLSDLDVEGLVGRHATRARDSLRGELPTSRTGPVVMSQGTFIPLLNPLRFATSGHAIYRQISPLSLGEPILGSREITGNALTLHSDPTLPFATDSRPFDGDGLGLSKVSVIENGSFQRIVADKRFADYLAIPATGGWHNEVVAAGSTAMADLLSLADGPIYHIVEFSWLNPNAVRGDFSTEIRLGYEITAEGTRVIRGGSLAGNVYDAFAAAHLARETALEGSYLGPTAIRFDALQVTGA